ncbi:MAG: hypothetical protein R3310_08830 [Candidatus Competibacteraceae bacterium]|nr:hypothetical protein [Candidatus Competibacteraceae bacterium]
MYSVSQPIMLAALFLTPILTLAAEAPAEELLKASIPGRFALEDVDNDGYLSPQEVDYIRGVDFLDFDLDDNGLLSLEEYARAMKLYLSDKVIGQEVDAMVLGGEADAQEVMEDDELEVEAVEVEEVEMEIEGEVSDDKPSIEEALERVRD